MSNQILVNNKHQVDWKEGLTVTHILKELNFSFKMLLVKVDGQLIKKEAYDTFLIPQNADVKVHHLMSGG